MNIINEYHNLNDLTMVNKYLGTKMIPYNNNIIIKSMISINYNNKKCKYMKLLTYSAFNEIDPETFKKPINKFDYILSDDVSPVLIFDKNNEIYRVNHQLWQILTDVISGNIINKENYNIDIFPCEIYLDCNNVWIIKLVDMVKPKID